MSASASGAVDISSLHNYDAYTSMRRSEQTTTPRPCTCTTVRRASRVLAREFDAGLKPAQIKVTQFAVLKAIERHEGDALARVAEDLCMDRTSLYRAVASLENSGLIRLKAGADARSRTASITAKGRSIIDAAEPHWARTQTRIVDRFGRDRWVALVRELQDLADCAAAE